MAVSCGVGCRSGSDPALLWLRYRPAAVAPIQPLAWKTPYATGAPPPPPKKTKNKELPNRSLEAINTEQKENKT